MKPKSLVLALLTGMLIAVGAAPTSTALANHNAADPYYGADSSLTLGRLTPGLPITYMSSPGGRSAPS